MFLSEKIIKEEEKSYWTFLVTWLKHSCNILKFHFAGYHFKKRNHLMKKTIPLKFHNPLHNWVSVTWYTTIKLLLCHNKINCIISMILIYCYSLVYVDNFFKLFIQSSVLFSLRNYFHFALQLACRLASRITCLPMSKATRENVISTDEEVNLHIACFISFWSEKWEVSLQTLKHEIEEHVSFLLLCSLYFVSFLLRRGVSNDMVVMTAA